MDNVAYLHKLVFVREAPYQAQLLGARASPYQKPQSPQIWPLKHVSGIALGVWLFPLSPQNVLVQPEWKATFCG